MFIKIQLMIVMLIYSFQLFSQDRITLENEDIKAEFSNHSGALLGFVDKQSGWQIQRRESLGQSFLMLLPLPDRRLNEALGIDQKPPKVEYNATKQEVTFIWNGIKSKHSAKMYDITFTGTIRLTDDGLQYSGNIVNNTELTVEYICWPYLGDLTRPDKNQHLYWETLMYNEARSQEIMPTLFSAGYWGVEYPTAHVSLETPFLLIRNNDQGLYIGNHDIQQRELIQVSFQAYPGIETGMNWGGSPAAADSVDGKVNYTDCRITHFCYVLPKTHEAISPIVLKPFKGSWHNGVDEYKKWRSTWFSLPQRPTWLTEVHSWQQIQINSSEDNLNFRYNQLPEYARECKKHGITAIQLTGWNLGGQDKNNPSHDTDPRLGTFDELKDAIAECEKMGVRIILFNKYTWADIATDRFRKELKKYAVTDPYGDYYTHGGYKYYTLSQLQGINTRRFAPMCHLSKDWRKVAVSEFEKNHKLGVSGMLYDESQHHGEAYYCFNKSHNHKVPAYIFPGDTMLPLDFDKLNQKLNPDFLMFGEGCYDKEMQYYDGTYFRCWIGHTPMHRYIDSEQSMMIGVVAQNARNEINVALRCKYILSYEPRNFKGQLSEFPRTLEYGKKVDLMRGKYADYLWHGKYNDILGVKISASDVPQIKYSVLTKSDGKRAVVICNNAYNSENTITALTPEKIPFKGLYYVSPENPEKQTLTFPLKIPAMSAVVILEE